ncbi:MAG: hypothetical protein EA383_05215 [Spirochaetaceae bacterium]|nr:MAG: hypothetical protein EA383_05215 [Spirochaetaceae bacterium]
MDFSDRQEFTEYLIDQNFEPKVVPWMLRWVAEFVQGLNSFGEWDKSCQEYYTRLTDRVEPWRVSQAAKSVQLYHTFLQRGSTNIEVPERRSWVTVIDRVRREIRRQGKSFQTEKTYLYWIHRFRRRFSQVCPEDCTSEHVKDFLTWLANERNVAVATQNQAFNALMYGSGIRLNECLTLRHKDVDLAKRVLTVRQGKGNKDRYTVISGECVPLLKDHVCTRPAGKTARGGAARRT